MEPTTITILSRWSGRALYTHTTMRATMRAAVLAAVGGDANLGGADLRGADLGGADLGDANLRGADLGGANLRSGLRPLLAVESLDAKILAAITAQPESFDMSTWHSSTECGTTHCRAGWATVLAGPAGQAIEAVWGTAIAGALIYASSYPELPVPNFCAENETALADIRERAALATTKQEGGTSNG